MASLFIAEQGAQVRKSGGSLVVEHEGRKLLEVDCHRIDSLMLFGGVSISTAAMTALLDRGVETAFLSLRGELKGQLTPPSGKNVSLRIAQYRTYVDPSAALSLSKQIVQAKIVSVLTLIKRKARRKGMGRFRSVLQDMEEALRKARTAASLDELMGIEGWAARLYWGIFGNFLKEPELFQGRSKRPPKDPVNALLSFGYTLLTSMIQSLADARGLDPHLGCYHRLSYGRPSLALDLLEPYRALLVDAWVVTQFNRNVFTRADFEVKEDGGRRMERQALNRFLESWHGYMKRMAVRDRMIAHVDSYAQVLEGKRERMEQPSFGK